MNENNKNIESEFYLSQWIEGKLTEKEFKNLVSEDDFLAFSKLKKGINIFSELEKPLDNSFKNIKNRIKTKPKVKTLNYRWIASIAAMLIFFFSFYKFLGSDSVLNSTNFGEQKTIALLDGSQVILNAKSAITYSKKNWVSKREVYLNGEAFFKVKKGEKFTVKTKNGSITVLGTQFTVKSTNEYFEVICYQGKVKVTKNGESTILTPSNSYRKIKDKIIKNIIYTDNVPTWVSGESNYKSVPLKYVIKDLKNQYNIEIDDSRINNYLIFTGSFTHKNINYALKSVFNPVNINYKKTNTKQLVLENN